MDNLFNRAVPLLYRNFVKNNKLLQLSRSPFRYFKCRNINIRRRVQQILLVQHPQKINNSIRENILVML